MSFTFSIAESLLLEVGPLIEKQRLKAISEGPVGTFYLTVGKHHLLICLKHPLMRYHLLDKIPKGEKVPFLEDCVDGLINHVQLLNDDRILEMTLDQKGKKMFLIAELFPKKPNLYLLDKNRVIIRSWKQVKNQKYTLPEKPCPTKPSPHPQPITSTQIVAEYAEKELEQKKLAVELYINRKLRNLKKKQTHVEADLKNSLKWKELEHTGKLLQANLYRMQKGMETITVEDWEKNGASISLILDPKLPPQDIVANWFKKSKKRRAAINHLRDQIEKLSQEESRLRDRLDNWDQFELPDTSSVKKSTFKPKCPYRQYKTESGMLIWVGKSAKDNDSLTFTYAKGSDWWFHAHDVPGSHVVLRVEKGKEPDEASIQQAMQCALRFSRAKDEKHADILITQVKYVSRLKKSKSGQVMISKKQIRQI